MSASKKRQTMAKHARERAVKEKRALKLERKREAAEIRLAKANGTWVPPVDESDELAVSDELLGSDELPVSDDSEPSVTDSVPSVTDSPAQAEPRLA